jgi:hypothetical protein
VVFVHDTKVDDAAVLRDRTRLDRVELERAVLIRSALRRFDAAACNVSAAR